VGKVAPLVVEGAGSPEDEKVERLNSHCDGGGVGPGDVARSKGVSRISGRIRDPQWA